MAFFTDSNGGNDATTANPERLQYALLQQLAADLANGTVADYNWITPHQYNDMHTALAAGYQGVTGDPAKILQGDDFFSQADDHDVQRHQNHGVIVIWFDESEQDGVTGDNPDEFDHTIGEIIISNRAHFEREWTSVCQLGELHTLFRFAHLAEGISLRAISGRCGERYGSV